METNLSQGADRRARIESMVVTAINEMIQDWDLALDQDITTETRLIQDLGFESIDVVQLAVALEQAFEHEGLPFENLFMHAGDYVEEISVNEVVEFMSKHLNNSV